MESCVELNIKNINKQSTSMIIIHPHVIPRHSVEYQKIHLVKCLLYNERLQRIILKNKDNFSQAIWQYKNEE